MSAESPWGRVPLWGFGEVEASTVAQVAVGTRLYRDAVLRRTVHEHLGDDLVHSAVVGAAHHDAAPDLGGLLPGAPPTFFFAPDQMRKRNDDWGPAGIEDAHAKAWKQFVPVVEGWVDVVVGTGPEGLRADWLETLAGATRPRIGHVLQL